MKIIVDYSLDLDTWNYLRSVYRFVWYIHGRSNLQKKLLSALPEDLVADLKSTKDEKQARKTIKKFLLKNIEVRKKKYFLIAQNIESAWEKESFEIETKLEKLYENKIPFRSIKIFLSTLPICPYNFEKKWIMVFGETNTKKQLQIITHELNHFMFYYYFGEIKNELGKEKFESLKEALTVFTNPEEKGYPNQKRIRDWLSKQKRRSIPEIIKSGRWKEYL